uniref:General secretion pathway protein E n=1 Tax=Pseudomonas fluorescens (strain SBW25) TaxID=216595 RepID=A0A0G4E514_PSEFS|nr:ATPase, T2SS/T4P/T4SS family [Pseudomonas fluorescens]CEK42032.1 General secretion pathway protein E [Pseudomonas fluorescens SBW25]
MSIEAENIKLAQAKLYKYLVDKNRVSPQIAESQPVSESMASILHDIIRVAKDDSIVTEAVANTLGLFHLYHVEEGLLVTCAGPKDGWLIYSDHLCVTNPYDKDLVDLATAWARNKDIKYAELGVVSNTYLSQLRTVHGGDIDEDGTAVDNQRAAQHVDDIVRLAASVDASDIHFVPTQSDKVDLQFRIDGVLKTQKKIDLSLYHSMVRAVIEHRCNLPYSAITQMDGKFELALNNNKSLNLRVSTLPVVRRSETSIKMVLRLLGNNTSLANLKRQGLSQQNYEKMVRFGNFPNGLMIFTGPTGAGKTTSLYAQLIDMQNNNPNRNFHTVEDPCEMQQPGMSHTEVNVNLSFVEALRALLRQDPDVILVGEIRDDETAELAIKAAMTGHLVLSSLHTNNAHESIGRLLFMGIGMDLIVSNTTAILAQRLVRCLCEKCKVEYRLSDDPKRLRTYGQNKAFKSSQGGTKLFKANPNGCDYCGKTGLKGRHGVVEILEMTPELQVSLLKGANPSILRLQQIKDGTFEDLWDDGLRLVANGIVGFDQLESVLKPYQMERVGMNETLGSGQAVSVPIQQQASHENQGNNSLASL